MTDENPFENFQESKSYQGKSWAFTLNNYTPEDEKLLKDLEKSYVVYGREVGETGTPHLQVVIVFRKSVRFAALKKICNRAHWGKVGML